MKDLDKLKSAFDSIGIEYTIRDCDKNKGYQYLFIGTRQDIYDFNGTFESGKLETLLARHKFFEFNNGELVCYMSS